MCKSHIELRLFLRSLKKKKFFPACEERLGEAIRVLKDLLLKTPTSCGYVRSQYVLYKRTTRNNAASNSGSTGVLVSALQQDGKLLQRHIARRKSRLLFQRHMRSYDQSFLSLFVQALICHFFERFDQLFFLQLSDNNYSY